MAFGAIFDSNSRLSTPVLIGVFDGNSLFLFQFQITELNLDNCRSTAIVGLTDEFVDLESLSLINVGLTSLKGFPKLPNLRRVIDTASF